MNSSLARSKSGSLRASALFLLTLAVVVGLSLLLRYVWSSPKEELPDLSSLQFTSASTVSQVIKSVERILPGEEELAPKLVAKSLQLKLPDQAQQTLTGLGIDPLEAQQAIGRTLALKAERESKDFGKIYVKFALWILLLVIPLVVLARRKLTPALRRWMLAAAVLVFGIILGGDPSPMGTVKDAIVLFGIHQAIFWPRIIALGVFLLIVVAANKFICSWGCQFGTLQEFIYRLNRTGKARKGALTLLKLPFVLTNIVRTAVFVALVLAAFIWAFDLISLIDPFQVFKPAHLGWLAGGFVALTLVASLFIYRPWCNLLCPFGLVSWLLERFSFWKIRVDYEKCTACKACTNSCPSEAMHGILTRKAMPADCFSCGDCLPACPTQAVQFARMGRIKPSSNESDILAKLAD